MTYGIALVNEFGDSLVDYTSSGLTYYVKSSGVCLDHFDVESFVSGGLDYYRYFVTHRDISEVDPPTPTAEFNGFRDFYERAKFPSPQMDTAALDGGIIHSYAETSSNKNDFVFYKMPSAGLVKIVDYINEISDASPPTIPHHMGSFANTSGSLATSFALDYKVVSTDLPPVANGNNGIVVYDSASNILFDTRREIVAFKDFIELTEAEASSIVLSNAVVDKTLRVPVDVNNTWISSASFLNYKVRWANSGSYLDAVNVKLLNGSTIRFSKERFTDNSTSYSPGSRTNFGDSYLLLAEF